jgi:hypothetical protein
MDISVTFQLCLYVERLILLAIMEELPDSSRASGGNIDAHDRDISLNSSTQLGTSTDTLRNDTCTDKHHNDKHPALLWTQADARRLFQEHRMWPSYRGAMQEYHTGPLASTTTIKSQHQTTVQTHDEEATTSTKAGVPQHKSSGEKDQYKVSSKKIEKKSSEGSYPVMLWPEQVEYLQSRQQQASMLQDFTPSECAAATAQKKISSTLEEGDSNSCKHENKRSKHGEQTASSSSSSASSSSTVHAAAFKYLSENYFVGPGDVYGTVLYPMCCS